jgi:hypothetical protein
MVVFVLMSIEKHDHGNTYHKRTLRAPSLFSKYLSEHRAIAAMGVEPAYKACHSKQGAGCAIM